MIADEMHESIVEMLDDLGFVVSYQPDITREQMIETMGPYHGLIIRSKTTVDKEIIDAAANLEFIARAGAGLDQIDVAYVESKGVEMLNAPEGNRDALAEHAMGLLLSMLNNIVTADKEVRNWQWQREANRGVELSDKTVGIIGFGYMGQAFVQRLRAFDCRVLVYDKYKKGFGTKNVEEVSLDKLFEKTDILSLHVPLTDETKSWVNKDFINNFEKDIYLLNTARGEIIPTKDLLELLDSGKVIRAGLDVLEKEKFNQLNHEEKAAFEDLFQRKNVILSPHVGGWTFASYKRINEVLVGKISNLYHIG